MQRLTTLGEALQSGKITVELRFQALRPGDFPALAALAAMAPATVEWGAAVDTMPEADFHAMARELSGPDTMHFASSRTWFQRVKASSALDAGDSSMRAQVLSKARSLYADTAGEVKVKPLLTLPPVDDALRVCDGALRGLFGAKWVEAFGKAAGLEANAIAAGPPDLGWSPLHAHLGTVRVGWTYNGPLRISGPESGGGFLEQAQKALGLKR